MYNNREYQSVNLVGAASSSVIFTGRGILHSIIVNTANGGGTITITDTPSTTKGTITLTNSVATTLFYDIAISGGLKIATSTSPDITVVYTQG